MKKYSSNYIAAISLIGCSVLANTSAVCQKEGGVTMCKEGEVNMLGANGIVKTKGTKIHKRLTVKGQALLQNTEVNEIKIFGEAILSDTIVHGQCEIYGHLDCQKTQFKRPITIWSNQVHAADTSFQDIIMAAEHSHNRLHLTNKTVVNGNIVFKGNPGTVSLSGGSRVTGKIINGRQI